MEINKILIFVLLIIITIMALGNMCASYYFINKAINIIEQQASPLTISKTQAEKLKRLIKN